MTPNKYLQGCDRVGQYIPCKIRHHYNALYVTNWYEHKPQKVVETKSATTLWNSSIHKDRTMQANKQDIAIKDLKRKTFKLIDFTFPIDINIFAKKFENIST